jgi:hypothetical protein
MSDLRIGLVAEGKTDLVIIEAALKAVLSEQTFVLTLLQPETSDPFGGAGPHGGGWGGVYKWCRQLVSMQEPVAGNSSLFGYDLILIHVDADVTGFDYHSANIDEGLDDLPCSQPCPPAADSVDALRRVVAGWLDQPNGETPSARWVFCNPAMCSEAWLVTALYRDSVPAILNDIECNRNLENWLGARPRQEGKLISSGKKLTPAYRRMASTITASWAEIRAVCTQADRFDNEVRLALA